MGRNKKPRRKSGKRGHKPPQQKRQDLALHELKSIVDKARTALSDEDHQKLDAAIDTLAYVTQELEAKGASVRRLRAMLFGAKTEKTADVLDGLSVDEQGEDASSEAEDESEAVGSEPEDAAEASGSTGSDGDKTSADKEKNKRKGHGRNGADSYTGAERVLVPHETLKHKDPCPECPKGKVYRLKEPATLVRVRGIAPLNATVYELDRFRCNLCGEVFTAEPPAGIGTRKYDETAVAMLGLFKYGTGFPFNRLEQFHGSLGIPLPSGTQWGLMEQAEGEALAPVFCEFIYQAAQGTLLHNDDTTMNILDLDKEMVSQALLGDDMEGRTGSFTTGIISTVDAHQIALFFTGRKHAGENLERVLAHRAAELGPPIQMCDALPHNTTGSFPTLVANCLAHGRRKFVEVAESFPPEVTHVLEKLRKVYKHDAETKELEMNSEERLAYHQGNSKPVMDNLKLWLDEQIDEHLIEPNSGLGDAIKYLRKHWEKLTLFLTVAGAPLDNNICERALKKAILHRKNALFYKTSNGARVGDTFMSLIHTAQLNKVNPFDYLVALLRNPDRIQENPADWMPWNFHLALAETGPT